MIFNWQNAVCPSLRKLISSFMLSVFITLILTGCNNSTETPVLKYNKLTQTGSWKVRKIDSTANSGHIKLENKIWLMHFLHWWQLDENRTEISTGYTKKLLMNLWGMQFTLTGIEGETQVNGHKAFFVEGMLGDFVKTKFIVWNCPETNRRFLSDCNINISLNTPDDLLELQVNDITKSVCCHSLKKTINNPKITQRIVYDDENIAFNIPANWRSGFYVVNPNSDKNIPGYYKNGITENRGTIWNLITDSEKEINFIWKKNNSKLSAYYFKKALLNFFNDTIISMKDTLKYRSVYANVNPQPYLGKNGYFESSGNFDVITDIVGYMPIDTSNYKYNTFFWRNNKTEYLIVASMVAYNNMWGIPFDLAPTGIQLKEFINTEVLKIINNHPIRID